MAKSRGPQNEVYWYKLRATKTEKLNKDLSVDVVIVGGGMAGLMAAQKFKVHNRSMSVAVIEATVCGGGASGKSSGFITPDSELGLKDLLETYGEKDAKRLWNFVKGGIASIRETISQRSIRCDFTTQDSLFIANDANGFKKVRREYNAHRKLGYEAWLYDSEKLERAVGSKDYFGAVRYKETFGMIAYLYCQDLKESLKRDGVMIFEETPTLEIKEREVKTKDFTVIAEKIVVCTDHFLPTFKIAEQEIYHAQTFLAVSKPLSRETIYKLFPSNPMMVWDTDLIYQYYRIVQGNRLLIGAASLLYTYAKKEKPGSNRILKKMHQYLDKKFPGNHIEFDYFWPGLIGVSKDFLPIAGRDPVMKSVYFIGGAAGLPWAAALGEYIADAIMTGRSDFNSLFTPERAFPIGKKMQIVLSKPLAFAISHGLKKYFL